MHNSIGVDFKDETIPIEVEGDRDFAIGCIKNGIGALCIEQRSFCTFRDSIMSIYHCSDNYILGLMRYAEMYDILGLYAPKPIVIVAGKNDDIFPIDAVEYAFKRLKKIYIAAGAGDNCQLVIGDGGHRFYADDAWPAMEKLMQ